MGSLDSLTRKRNQSRIDSWNAVHKTVKKYIEETRGKMSISSLKKELAMVQTALYDDAPEIRQGLKELSEINRGY
jgi:hypothetical protein